MKHFEQNLGGLRIIYIHNPYDCENCSKEMNVTFPKARKSKESRLPKNGILSKRPLQNSCMNKKAVKDNGFKYPSPITQTPVKSPKKADKPDDFSEPKKFKPLPLFSGKNKQARVLPKLVKKISEEKSTSSNTANNNSSTSPEKATRYQYFNLSSTQLGTKVPGKGTLKRKRWLLDTLNHKNDNYEDDMFENQEFAHFQELFDSESDNADKYENLQTPVFPFSLSPREASPTPSDKDCFNPTELEISRRRAEEYQYRKMKRKKPSSSPEKKKEASTDSQKKTEDVLKRLEEVANVLNLHKRQNERTSDNEDEYNSDSPPDSCSVIA